MSLRSAVAVALLAGCGGQGSAPAPVIPTDQPPPKLAPAPPPCITPLDEAAAITHATAEGSQVRYCVAGNPDQCFAVDLTTGALTQLAGPPELGEATSARVETTNPELKVCHSETCKTLTLKVLPAAASIRAATNPDGSFAVFLLGDAAKGKGYAEIWDVAKARKVATFRYARGAFRCGDVAMLDDTIYLAAATCDAPGARATLYSLRGKRLGFVGGKDFGVFGNAYTKLEDTTWAFLEENGSKLALQDVARGKLERTIDLSPLFEAAGSSMGNPGESAIVRVDATTLAVIAGAPARGSVAAVDLATGRVTVWKAPLCGALLDPDPPQ